MREAGARALDGIAAVDLAPDDAMRVADNASREALRDEKDEKDAKRTRIT